MFPLGKQAKCSRVIRLKEIQESCYRAISVCVDFQGACGQWKSERGNWLEITSTH